MFPIFSAVLQQDPRHKEFEQQTLPHMEVLYNYALRMTGNKEDAKDLLQETFLKAYRFWNKFEQGTNLRAWLFRIMKNTYINLYRKEAKEPDKVDYDEIEGTVEISSEKIISIMDPETGMTTQNQTSVKALITIDLANPPRWWPKNVPPTMANYYHVTVVGCTGMSSGACEYQGQCQGKPLKIDE